MLSNRGTCESPLVSVIMPCYNQARYLPSAIASLKEQTLERWECLIVDDGSTDASDETASKLAAEEPRLRVFRQENKGPSAARNVGLQQARGTYIQLLDADDLLEKKKLEIHVAHLRQADEDEVVYSDVRYFTDDKPNKLFFGIWGEDSNWVEELAVSKEPALAKVLRRNIMAINCPLFHRATFERVGSFHEEIFGCEDWEYWIRCVLAGIKFHYVALPETRALVRSHTKSTSRDLNRMLEGEVRFRHMLGSLLANNARLRLENFEQGANRLGELNPQDYRYRLLELAKANATKRVYLYALLRLIDRNNILRAGARTIRTLLSRKQYVRQD